ncbi:MAG: hypothetical protein A2139_06845 [Desulfobacca sp. RBG_16_60_12]|nr:MAG: hypothetical protein A2139_06845 [Desulfobacca sp. RBG_16_60_12]
MRLVPPQLTPELTKHLGRKSVAKAPPFPVSGFHELIQHVSRLAYANKDHLLFFRGQDRDYQNKARASTIYPSIYRGELLSQGQLEIRFDVLASAAKRLCDALRGHEVTGHQEVQRRRYIQWSILQHYQVCPTPLLDLTHSLRVAASFAHLSTPKTDPLVLVFAFPYLTNRVSANSEYDLVVVRLLSICPPEALRPYYQDGYLAGTDEVTTDYPDKDELDFNRLLVAKFVLKRSRGFWRRGFSPLPRSALFPELDLVQRICNDLREELGTEVEPGRLGQFLQAWTDLENDLMTLARQRKQRVFSLREAVSVLHRAERLSRDFLVSIDQIRQLRNRVVHQPRTVTPDELAGARIQIRKLQAQLNLRA